MSKTITTLAVAFIAVLHNHLAPQTPCMAEKSRTTSVAQAPTNTVSARMKKCCTQIVTGQIRIWSKRATVPVIHLKCGGPILSLHLGWCAFHSRFSIRAVDHLWPPARPENGPLFAICCINTWTIVGQFSRPVLSNNIIMSNQEHNWSTLFVHFIGPPSLAKILWGHGGRARRCISSAGTSSQQVPPLSTNKVRTFVLVLWISRRRRCVH